MRIGRVPSIISTIVEHRHRHSMFFSTVSTVVTITIISNTFKRELCTNYGLLIMKYKYRNLHVTHRVYITFLTHCTRVSLHGGVLCTLKGTTKSRVVERSIVQWSSRDFKASSLDGATSHLAGGAMNFKATTTAYYRETSTVWG